MNEDREAILSRVRGALAPLHRRAPLPDYDPEIAVLRQVLAGRDLAELFAERLKRVGGLVFTDAVALAAHLRAGGRLHGYCDPALWSALAPWVHVAVVRREDIHCDISQAVAALGDDPNVIWCTGPSKTADVEGILIEGVHGPGEQLALIV